MPKTLIVPSQFTAVDKFSAPMRRISNSMTAFANKTEVALARVNRAERRMTVGFKKATGVVGQFGIALGGLAIGTEIFNANKELDKSIASLKAITGLQDDQFGDFEKQINRVASSTKKFKGDVATAFQLIGSAQPELLANAEALGKVTEAAITLSKAGGMSVEEAANSLTKSMNQFGVGADDAAKFVDIFATSQQKGTATIKQISESMVVAGGTARAFGLDFDSANAFIQAFAKGGVTGSQAGTQLSGALSKLSKVSKKEFNPAFTDATQVIQNLKDANLSYVELTKLTDSEGAKWITTLINQNDTLQGLTGQLYENGNAVSQAKINSSSLSTIIQELTDSFKNAVTTTNSNNIAMNAAKNVLAFLANNMEKVLLIVGALIAAFAAYKVAIVAIRVGLIAFNVVQGISAAMTGVMSVAMGKSKVAMVAYNIATKAAAVAQWLLNAAMSANPIGLIVVGIAAVIALIYIAIKHWDKWKKYLFAALEPVYFLIDGFKSMIENWKTLIKLFASGDIMGGLKQLGAMLLEQVLAPLQMILMQLAKIPGMGDKFKSGADEIMQLRKDMGLDVSYQEERALNAEAEQSAVQTQNINRVTQNNAQIDINDNSGRAKVVKNTGVPIRMTKTVTNE